MHIYVGSDYTVPSILNHFMLQQLGKVADGQAVIHKWVCYAVLQQAEDKTR
jgi:hypothetical protein